MANIHQGPDKNAGLVARDSSDTNIALREAESLDPASPDGELSNLKAQWRKIFNQDPPFKASREFIQRHVLWADQAKRHGGISRKVNNQLNLMMRHLREGNGLVSGSETVIKPGTRLIREYNHEKHEVVIMADGFLYQGKVFSSLSRIARDITGTRWNGKVFFGLKRRT